MLIFTKNILCKSTLLSASTTDLGWQNKTSCHLWHKNTNPLDLCSIHLYSEDYIPAFSQRKIRNCLWRFNVQNENNPSWRNAWSNLRQQGCQNSNCRRRNWLCVCLTISRRATKPKKAWKRKLKRLRLKSLRISSNDDEDGIPVWV